MPLTQSRKDLESPEPSEKELLESILQKLEGAYAPATLRAYRADVETFIDFLAREGKGVRALPGRPEDLARLIDHLSGGHLKSSSIRRVVASIATVHRIGRFENPSNDSDVKLALRRMYRKLGRSPRQAQGIQKGPLEDMLKAIPDSLRGTRDRALLLLAYETLGRRSELIALTIGDLEHRIIEGRVQFRLCIRRSKTDPEGIGRWLTLSLLASEALTRWLVRSRITEGRVFRGITPGPETLTQGLNPTQFNRILKGLGKAGGLDPKAISGHSLRVGAAQDLLLEGASLPLIMNKGRWTKTDTVMRYLEHTPVGPFGLFPE